MDLDGNVGKQGLEANKQTARKFVGHVKSWARAIPPAAPVAGALSGLLSWLAMNFTGELALNHVPVVPAACFWIAFCAVLIDVARRPVVALAALPAIYGAWFLAINAAMVFSGNPYKTEPKLFAAGAFGGFVGTAALLTIGAMFKLGFHGIGRGIACLIVGTVAGLSLRLGGGSDRLPYDLGLAVMFIAWQASVLACLAAMSRAASTRSTSPADHAPVGLSLAAICSASLLALAEIVRTTEI